MAYDSARGKTVLFGGWGLGRYIEDLGDTWEWDGSAWKRAATTGPSPRSRAAMAYDSARGKTVLFGGVSGSLPLGDTWEWDGTRWEPVATTGPAGRERASIAYDSARGKVVLFGGGYYDLATSQFVAFGDTWEWDGKEWKQVSTSGPKPRSDAAMAYDPARGRTVLFGGKDPENAEAPLGDTWEWDGSQWTQAATTGPTGREQATMAWDSARGGVLLFGGLSPNPSGYSTIYADTWEWDGTQWEEVATTGPSGRVWTSMAGDSARRKVVLFGGSNYEGFYNDTWEWDGTKWKNVTVTSPGKRDVTAMAYDSARHKTVLFGGRYRSPQGTSYTFFGDTWVWDGSAWEQKATTGPAARYGHAMAYDSARERTVLFGGYSYVVNQPAVLYGDTWEWDGNAWQEIAGTGPEPRSGAAMAYDSARGRTILFGGYKTTPTGAEMDLGDTWEWDGSQWKLLADKGPTPRTSAAMTYDSNRGRTVLFGGSSISPTYPYRFTSYRDTWEWDGVSWTQVATTGPRPRMSAAMGYDAERGKTVLFGGTAEPTSPERNYEDTWEWDGSVWTPVLATGPSPRWSAMAYDSDRKNLVLYGGSDLHFCFNDTWEHGSVPGAFTIPDAADTLRWAAGIAPLPPGLLPLFDLTPAGPSAGAVDLQDAILILRKASGLLPNP